MHGHRRNNPEKPRRLCRRNGEWTLREHRVVVSHWPDKKTIARHLPYRSMLAIENFAGRCNLRKQRNRWTAEQQAHIRKRVAESVSIKIIADELKLTHGQVQGRIQKMGIRYPRRRPKPFGNLLMDSIRQRAFDLNISMKELDEACGSGHVFRAWNGRCGVRTKHIEKALKVLDGHFVIEWSELADE